MVLMNKKLAYIFVIASLVLIGVVATGVADSTSKVSAAVVDPGTGGHIMQSAYVDPGTGGH